MNNGDLQITPDTKIGVLLAAYPQLEKVLIELAPAFKKLKNPVLRKTIAKVTSIRQAARTGAVPVADMVNQLRQAAGQSPIATETDEISAGNDPSDSGADWISKDKIFKSLDAREMIESGEQPLGRVMAELRQMPPGVIYELITPFEPAPLIDRAKMQGFEAISRKETGDTFKTYFRHSNDPKPDRS
jgi:hypothetical protein